MSDETIHKIKITDPGAGALFQIHASQLLVGDGAIQRIDLLASLKEKVDAFHREHAGKKASDVPYFECELAVKSSTLKFWVSGSANAIMRSADGTKPLADNQIGLIMEGAKALKVLGALRSRIPVSKVDDAVLELDGTPAFKLDDEAVSSEG